MSDAMLDDGELEDWMMVVVVVVVRKDMFS